ncbi:MAG: DNA-binding response regulator [Paenibacillus sp.]|jgi:DNA-binding response OmpR family regulator|nr:DNA-binding response regulator [Paenibacillus sp.]
MRVLIIEDDAIFGDMLSMYLAEEDFTVLRAATGEEGMKAFYTFTPDIILLDLVLPDANGMDLCVVFREMTTIPIIIISMNTKVSDRIQALTVGADDYLCKPFSMQELKARIIATSRRAHRLPTTLSQVAVAQEASSQDNPNRIRMDLERRSIYIYNKPIETTFSEFEIMKLFYQHPGKVFSRDDLINSIRGIDSYVNERSIDVHVTNLRKKIEDNPKQPQYIKTVWGIGYKFMYP